ncbi:uncharacterized protein BYT42DRAFT_291408 [Radiomyces spectabilis]|uniref:uncharacterized protein n=1 Tax=Radiomyces spectabilis TaxID=64574 RepID=UPI00221FD546|nr:uncharacterized protein BYT42DRAFT_291408 [Radiomyces spectabilis]KAI8381081.1 hypothetical protein BYT42DRAFT_291408 [Radiomyces spectabilis]
MVVAVLLIVATCLIGSVYLLINYACSGHATFVRSMILINHGIHQAIWVPSLLRVYLLGIAETVLTVIFKRGLFGAPSWQYYHDKVDTLIHTYRQQHAGMPVRTVIVTGIGFEIARGLLKAGFKVIIASRMTEAGKQAQDKLASHGDVQFIQMDLLSFKSVHQFVDRLKAKVPKGSIDIMINNAGIMNTPCALTEDGYEAQYQTNYLSPVLLTMLVLPWMAEDGQILFASSSTIYGINGISSQRANQTYRWDGLSPYAHSKLCLALFVRTLACQLEKKRCRIHVHAYHPGTVCTKLFAYSSVFKYRIFHPLFAFIMLTPKEGSTTPLYLCLSTLSDTNGQYWAEGVPMNIPNVAYDGQSDISKEELDRILWNQTLRACHLNPRIFDA